MKYLLSKVLLLVIAFVSCASDNPRPGTPECLTHTSVTTFSADESFTPEERPQLLAAVKELREISANRIKQDVVFRTAAYSEPKIFRMLSSSSVVKDAEEKQARRFGVKGYTLFGWQNDDPPRIFLVVDRVPVDQLHNLAAHELVHAAGLKWPDCDHEPRAPFHEGTSGERDCSHVKGDESLRSQSFTNTSFGPADLEICRASCLCP